MNAIKTAALMTAMMVLFILVGGALAGETGVIIAFIISLAMNFGSYWFSDKVVLSMYKAKEVSEEQAPDLHKMVKRLAANADLPMPKVYIVENQTPNAFATGRNPENGAVAVTTGILRVLNADELEGVLAHELAHIKNRDILISTIAATLVGTITFLARMAGFAMMFGGNDDEDGDAISSLVLMILSPIIAILIQMSISRAREYAADSTGSQINGNPRALASALNKLALGNQRAPMKNADTASAHMFIVNPLKGKSFKSLFSTHPSTEERVKRLMEIAEGRRI